MNRKQAEALRDFPELAGLIALSEAGWRFVPSQVVDGRLTDLHGFRAWPEGWTDAIRVRSDTDVMAVRSDGNEPPGVVWECAGTLAQVVEGLLSLPAPDDRLAPRLIRASGPVLWTPAENR
ncbi:hypothetical protein LWC34_41825 [Kibdelosporangium philippinense]|uniref:Uncharacterized protein n=1 Tax=Kibdelosporangium philippinense TaxID=211113 RepID=A0ABS8ZQV2_9PSEU|nr:hypothetical protein [Kibdelosporangium philippinense]MCE7009310.1 hypothetical protein [Kibdelosporangium philippinense]